MIYKLDLRFWILDLRKTKSIPNLSLKKGGELVLGLN